MMKRLLYIIAVAAGVAACAREQLEPVKIAGTDSGLLGYEHDGMVTFGFNPVFSGADASTKAMVEGADIKNLYVAVLDGSGYKLSEYIKAEPVTTGSSLANDTPYQYTIELKVSENKRILHFIANAPEDLRFGSENEVIGELYTTLNGDDTQNGGFQNAYWQRIELNNGITARPKEGEENYSTKLAKYNNVVAALNGVTLIRNYSKVSVDAPNCYNFELSGFWFVNYPDRGTVAPYNRNTKTFVPNYADYPTVEALEGAQNETFRYGSESQYSISGANYLGFMLQATEFITPTFDDANKHSVSSGVASGFVYEREKALISPMYIIVEGKYYPNATAESPRTGTSTTGFYKVAMQDNDGEFYAMLRNFNYLVRIVSVASAGKSSAEDALSGTPSGDISVNIDYVDIPNISDGTARMTVNQTTLVIIGPKNQPATAEILYKYEPDIVNHPGEGLGNEWVPEEDSDNPITDRPYVVITPEESGSSGDVIASMQVSYTYKDSSNNEWDIVVDGNGNQISKTAHTSGDGFGHITITTTNVGAVPKKQTVTITGKRYDNGTFKTITRSVNLVLRESLDMDLSVEPNTDTDPSSSDYLNGFIETGTGKDVILNICIEDNLPSSMFPLVFKIEPSNKSVTPDNAHSGDQDLPVRYGTDTEGYPTYWFEKSLSYSEYTDESVPVKDGIRTFPVWFKTILSSSATTFKVSQSLFEDARASLKNYVPSTFSSAAFSGSSHKVGEQENFSFHIDNTPLPAQITVKMKGVEPVKATTAGYTGTGFSQMTWQKTEDGYWYYTLEPTSADVSFAVVPYASGDISVELSAYLYSTVTTNAKALAGDTAIITDSDFVTACGQKVFGDNRIVPNQKAKLTIYIPKDKVQSSENVTVGGMSTTKVDNGDLWKVYTADNAYTATTSGYNENGYYGEDLIVSVGGKTVGSVNVPICGIKIAGNALTSASQSIYNQTNGTGWYVISNASFSGYHLYYNGTNIAGRQTSSHPYDYNSLFGFSAASGSTKVAVPSANSGSMYYANGYNDNLTANGTGTSYSFNGTQFSYRYLSTYYWREATNTGNVSGDRSNNDYRTFYVYPVTLSSPE